MPGFLKSWRLASRTCLLIAIILLCTTCSGGGATDNSRDYPPGSPSHPERLSLSNPDETDPLLWWHDNILSLVPEAVYPDTKTAQQAGRFIEETNRKRTEAGLPELQTLPSLNPVAQAHAMDQAIRDYWNHRTPEDLGSRDRIAAAGAGTVLVGGENSSVARPGASTVDLVVENFSIHPGHRELLYNTGVEYIGVGIFNYSPDEHVHYVQLLVSF